MFCLDAFPPTCGGQFLPFQLKIVGVPATVQGVQVRVFDCLGSYYFRGVLARLWIWIVEGLSWKK